MRTDRRRHARACNVALALLMFWLSASRAVAQSGPRVYRDKVVPHWSADGSRFWYLNDLARGEREFILVDAAKSSRAPAFDHDRAAAAIGKLTGRDVTGRRLPVDELSFADDGSLLLHGRDASWKLDPGTGELRAAPDEDRRGADALAPLAEPRPSRPGGEETSLEFVNRTDAPADVFWLTPSGEREKYATLTPGGAWTTGTYAGHTWLVAGPGGRVLGIYEASRDRSRAVIGGKPAPESGEPQRRWPSRRRERRESSPDGKWSVFTRDHNLVLRATAGGEEVPLSVDGKPGDAYDAGRVWWSPDSTKVVAFRTEPAQERKVTLIESRPEGQVQPKVRQIDYLKPGDKIAHPRPQLFHVDGRKHVPIAADLFPNPWSIEDVRWSADSSRFTFVYNQRGHQALRVVAVDAMTGAASALVDETSDTFVCYSGKSFAHWVGDDELIWMSERDGWNHLWLYDAKAGRVKNQVTRGEWVVQSVRHVDEEKRQIWFTAGGVRPGQDPYYAHFCRVNFDGSGLTVLTEGDGDHAVQWSPGQAYLIDTWSRVDRPPVTELRNAADGALVCRLEEADAADVLAARGGRWPIPFAAKGRDGKTDIYGVIHLPRDFDPAAKYPVIEDVYAGPQDFFTPKAFRPRYGYRQALADRGAIVVQCDGMGTSGRSKAFHDVCWKNLRDAGFPDRIAWVKAAAAGPVPQMDLSRVGIYGGSAGGQNAMAALLWHNDFYKVAVADCGCHDNRMDKIWWNEQWMGWPVGPEYEASSNVANAHLLKGKLLLIVGEVDANVDPASTLQAAAALQKADKGYELLIVAGHGHGAGETPYASRKRTEFLLRHLGVAAKETTD